MTRTSVFWTVCLLLICCALPIQAQQVPDATTNCSFTFKSGSGNTFLTYCVTANGNIPQIETPFGHPQMGAGG